MLVDQKAVFQMFPVVMCSLGYWIVMGCATPVMVTFAKVRRTVCLCNAAGSKVVRKFAC